MVESIVRLLHILLPGLATTNAKGVRAIKKHKICIAEGREIRAPVSGAPIEFKRTVGNLSVSLSV